MPGLFAKSNIRAVQIGPGGKERKRTK